MHELIAVHNIKKSIDKRIKPLNHCLWLLRLSQNQLHSELKPKNGLKSKQIILLYFKSNQIQARRWPIFHGISKRLISLNSIEKVVIMSTRLWGLDKRSEGFAKWRLKKITENCVCLFGTPVGTTICVAKLFYCLI